MNLKYTGLIRIIIVALASIAQLVLLALLVIMLRQNYIYLYFALEVTGLIEVLFLANKDQSSAYTIAWIIVILILPVFGIVLYLMWGRAPTHSKKSKRTREIVIKGINHFDKNEEVRENLEQDFPDRKKIVRFLENEGFPIYRNTVCKYYQLGEFKFRDMIHDMKQAKRFIFIEYFIINEGIIWSMIYEVLREKAREGVEVRILYDDLGSIITLPKDFIKQLENDGIKVTAFNPVHKYISRFYLNFRNHQKIVVIDGNIGYTGGANLADEYANLYEKHGHWKDTAVRLEGDAVWSLTVTFLQMWQSENLIEEDYLKYKPVCEIKGDGFYQPFSDSPIHSKNVAKIMYRQIITSAKKYVYITTPYLVIDDSMVNELCLAALTGTDVRIIVPKVYDKWYVYKVTCSNYKRLLEAGVRIFEYTPGYMHAKIIISDDDNAIVGSINMDYRSFYLHFENGVWICGSSVVQDIKEDILKTMEQCEEITLEEWLKRPLYKKAGELFFRIFAPLL
ncbi:MAG TPA: cardiolipin synthase [Thermoclostridium sp.]